MKKKYFNLMMMAALALASTSCTDFLTEDNKAGETAELTYQTATGIEGLCDAAYAYTRGWWGKEPSLGLAECAGTDLFYYGFDCKQKSLAKYDISSTSYGYSSSSSSNAVKDNPCFDQYWELFYAGIDVANSLLKYAPQCSAIGENKINQYNADGHFLRALYYSQLVAMFGPVPYNSEAVTGSTNNNPVRVPEKDVYKHILDDLKEAMEGYEKAGIKTAQNPKDQTQGRGSYYAAKALYAREALYAASWLGETSVEGYDNLYQEALQAAEDVINNSGADTYPRFSDTWNMNNEDANVNRESLYAVHYSSNLSQGVYENCVPYRFSTADGEHEQFNSLLTRTGYTRGGSAMLLMFNPRITKDGCTDVGESGTGESCLFVRVTGSKTDTIRSKTEKKGISIGKYYSPYGRGFVRFTPSLYLWKLYDQVRATDQRCDGTLLEHYNIPKELAGNSKFYTKMDEQEFKDYDEAYAEDGNYFNGGGYAVRFSVLDGDSPEGQALQAEAKDKYRLQFASGGEIPVFTSSDVALAEPTENNKVAKSAIYGDNRYDDERIDGSRNFPGIKKFLDDQYNSTYPTHDVSSRDCIVLRLAEMYLIKAEAEMATGANAAALKTINELRDKRKIKTLAAGANSLQSVYGESSVDIETILRERALELCGEYQRWFDLKRTHKLIEHVQAYNHQARGIELKHYYRPIPETELNSVANYIGSAPCSQDANGVLQYTTTAEGMWQNPGY